MWTVYRNPRDFPGRWVVRRSVSNVDGVTMDKEPLAVAGTIAEARDALPPGLACTYRHPDDDPCIAEVWL